MPHDSLEQLEQLPAVPGDVAVGDRVRFVIPPVAPGAAGMAGDGFACCINQGLVFVAVLGYPQLLMVPPQCCAILERGALVRRIALT